MGPGNPVRCSFDKWNNFLQVENRLAIIKTLKNNYISCCGQKRQQWQNEMLPQQTTQNIPEPVLQNLVLLITCFAFTNG